MHIKQKQKKISDVSLAQIRGVAAFRSRGRIPVLCWMSPDSQTHTSPPVLCRCSQPQVGISGKRCLEDEDFLLAINNATGILKKLCVMDARPRANAVANSAKGGGNENLEHYTNCNLIYLRIDNIHAVRDSYTKMLETCTERGTKNFFSEVDSSGWLQLTQLILQGAVQIAENIHIKQISVVVHCSDGWDRTAQLCSLSELLLDPFYRSFRGFQILIEKEWCDFGHKFHERCGHGDKNYGDSQRSPIFLEFLDCVWQIWTQYPCSFEFNENFLVFIAEHLYSCIFGTFFVQQSQTT
eukprot:TRINITY_DN5442_c0_g1_i2.p1 TRINITY_DN5442_c0_g1~~TRINITY_DN5442_c0_g1_i2.p1  ORF type:complete len:296 (+),score=46.84 TRINITY_DN5442_c0_g1_i2:781-1668(+)